MYWFVGIIAGFIMYRIIHYLRIKENRKHCMYDSENKCWIAK